MKRSVLNLLIVICLSCSFLFGQTKDMTNLFNENAVRAHVKFLADDLLEGRGPGTRGGELAAKYIASQMEVLGLKEAKNLSVSFSKSATFSLLYLLKICQFVTSLFNS